MGSKAGNILVKALGRIPMFKDLHPLHMKRFLRICVLKVYKPGFQLCINDMPSDSMFILLTGELVVVTGDGTQVATIFPVKTVGEMGVITGERRSATVEVSRLSHIFVITKRTFDFYLSEDAEVRATIYKNIIDDLSFKLANSNKRIIDHQKELTSGSRGMAAT